MKSKKKIRIGIIGTSFREDVTSELEKRCVATLLARGIAKNHITMVRVPGALEVPLIVKKMAKQKRYDALITFGAIVKGKTYHFEQIANECSRGCAEVALQYEIPVIFEILAVYKLSDAFERATRKVENKGVEAAETALSMITLISKL
ncbi:MAG: 6,7-dimethyl-8-ribityllumazine synthase [bacterium]|nr:6,7-dimethyl-8-ribityllumazine synthase [bacterium]